MATDAQLDPLTARSRLPTAKLKRDIAAFEESYQALLTSLKCLGQGCDISSSFQRVTDETKPGTTSGLPVSHRTSEEKLRDGPPSTSLSTFSLQETPATKLSYQRSSAQSKDGTSSGPPAVEHGSSSHQADEATRSADSRMHRSQISDQYSLRGSDKYNHQGSGAKDMYLTALDPTFSWGATRPISPPSPPKSPNKTVPRLSHASNKLPRTLKLDEVWNDKYREHEDEADELIRDAEMRQVASADIHSFLHTHSLRPLQRRINSLRACSIILPLIHPHSVQRILWDSTGCILLTCALIFIPITLAWDVAVYNVGGIFLLHYVLDLIFWPLDVIVNLNTAYYERDSIVENRLKIFLKYWRSWFLFDVLLVIIDYVLLAGPGVAALSSLKNFRFLRFFRLLRILKLSKVSYTVSAAFIAKGSQWMALWLAMLKVVVVNVVCTTHFLACLWYYIGRTSRERGNASWIDSLKPGWDVDNVLETSHMRQYVFSIHWVLAQVTPAPYNIQPQNLTEQIFAISVILFSLFVFGNTMAKLRSTLDTMGRQNAERSSKRAQLAIYLRNCQVSVELSARILRFAEIQMNKAASVAEPPSGLVSKTLMSEVLLSQRRPTLVRHPLLRLIDNPTAQQSFVVKKLCSEGFKAHVHESQYSVFVEGALANWWVFTRVGTYELRQWGQQDLQDFSEPFWFAEVCLFVRHIHSSTLNTTSVAEVFMMSRHDLLPCIESSPIVIVSFADYARKLIALISNLVSQTLGAVPDYLPQDLAEQACRGVHLHYLDGKHGSKGLMDWEISRGELVEAVDHKGTDLDVTEFMRIVLEDAATPDDNEIREAFPELGVDGALFSFLGHSTECNCVVASISSALMLANDQYEDFVLNQDPSQRLTLAQWSNFQSIVQWARLDSKAVHAVCVFLLLRGLVKSKRFSQVCAPKTRASRERMMLHCLMSEDLPETLVSVARLDEDQISLVRGISEMQEIFNMPQFLQGENVAASVEKLQRHLITADPEVFPAYVLSQVCIMCGLNGNQCTLGSQFMSTTKAVPVLIGVRHIQFIEQTSARMVFSSYLMERSRFAGLDVVDIETLALSRLICLTRIIDREHLQPLQDAWRDVSKDEKAVLTEHLTTDGIDSFAVILLFLPLYLSNALENSVVGTLRALRILVQVLNVLMTLGFEIEENAVTSQVVEVDIQSLAEYAGSVHNSLAFMDACDYIKIKRVEHKIFVLIDDKPTSADLQHQMAQVYRIVRQIAGDQARSQPRPQPQVLPANGITEVKPSRFTGKLTGRSRPPSGQRAIPSKLGEDDLASEADEDIICEL